MVRGCGNSCVKIILIFVNVLVLLFGVAMLGLGIWALVSVDCTDCRLQWLWKSDCRKGDDSAAANVVRAARWAAASSEKWEKEAAVLDNLSAQLAAADAAGTNTTTGAPPTTMTEVSTTEAPATTTTDYCTDIWSDNAGNITGSAWGVVVAGALLTVLGFLGCCGAAMENRLMLGGYAVLVLVAAVIQVLFAVLLLVNVGDGSELHKAVGEAVRNLTDSDLILMQQALECCGDRWEAHGNGSDPRPRPGIAWKYCEKDNGTTSPVVVFTKACPDRLWEFIVAIVVSTASVSLFQVLVDAVAVSFSCCLIVAIGRRSSMV